MCRRVLFLLSLLFVCSGPASAQDQWPSKPIRWIAPYAAGGFADIRARKLAIELSKNLGQPVYVENRAGAGGVIGTDAVAKAAPDGYTIGMGNLAALSVNVSLMKKLPYDPLKDLLPVVLIERSALIFTAGPGLPVNSVQEMIAYAKANPAKLGFGSSGVGGAHHLSGEMLKLRTGIDVVHIPYKGGAPAAADVMAGHLPMMFEMAMRDLTGASAEGVAATRAKVATQGWGFRLLTGQGPDGTWGGTAWNHGWNCTMHVLMLLRDLGLDPASDAARQALELVRDRVTWQGCGPPECAGNPFFAGETEPCINGQVAAVGAYFGQDVESLVDRLLAEQLPDGGWNCEAESGSTRSSFNTTICVLEALLEYERTTGSNSNVTAARERGQEYLLERHLFRRRSTGEAIEHDRKGGAAWMRFAFPTWWHYDVLRGLDYLRSAGVAPDARVAEAIDAVAANRDPEGRWPLEACYPGAMPIETDEGEGRPSRWNTLRALRVLEWYSNGHQTRMPPDGPIVTFKVSS